MICATRRTETLTKSQTTRAETGQLAKPMPLKWYTDQGFNGDWIVEHCQDKKEIVHGTECFKLDMAYMSSLSRDDEVRAEKLVSEPAKKTIAKR